MLSHLKERQQRNGKLKNIVKIHLCIHLKQLAVGGDGGVDSAEMKEQSVGSFWYLEVNRPFRSKSVPRNQPFILQNYVRIQ
jgi:hypothetical protein